MLITLAGSMFTFVVFVSSALLIALQLASVQLTPRIIGLVFRDCVTKLAMTVTRLGRFRSPRRHRVAQSGGPSIQVSRRLHAMLEGLLRVLPAQGAPALRPELGLLDRAAARSFTEPEDRVLAADADSQGVGGGRVDENGRAALPRPEPAQRRPA